MHDDLQSLQWAAQGYPPSRVTFHPDGHVDWAWAAQEKAARTYNFSNSLRGVVGDAQAIYARQSAPSVERVQAFDELLRDARANGTRVLIILTPVHPEARAQLEAAGEPPLHAQGMRLLRGACQPGVDVVDLSDPQKAGLPLDHFVDGWHFDATMGDLMLREALAPGASACPSVENA